MIKNCLVLHDQKAQQCEAQYTCIVTIYWGAVVIEPHAISCSAEAPLSLPYNWASAYGNV